MNGTGRLRLLALGLLPCAHMVRADAFFYDSGTGMFMTITAPGADPGTTVATGINSSGTMIVGYFENMSGVTEGFLDSFAGSNPVNGTFTEFSAQAPSGAPYVVTGTYPWAVNNSGQIAGYYTSSEGASGPPGAPGAGNGGFEVQVTGGVLGTFSDMCCGVQYLGINNATTISGIDSSCSSSSSPLPPTQCGILVSELVIPSEITEVTAFYGINNSGEVLAYSGLQGGYGVYLVTNGIFSSSVPGLPGIPWDINDSGQVVGTSSSGGFVEGPKVGEIEYINVTGALATSAFGIDDAGDVVGSFTPAPEPSSLLLVSFGVAGIAALKLYRRNRAERGA